MSRLPPARTAVLAAVVLGAAPAALAQPLPKVMLSAGAFAQPGDRRLEERFGFDQYLERATVRADHDIRGGGGLDGAVVVRIWRGVAAGVGVSHLARRISVAVTGEIPHPFHFSQPREIRGRQGDVPHEETAVHVLAAWLAPVGRRAVLMVAAGPSRFSIAHGFVRGLRYSESYPFDTATFASADVTRVRGTAAGFHAGAEVIWRLHRRAGAALLVRYTHAAVTLRSGPDRTARVEAGGIQAGGGVRWLF
ncbi:MAG TPA: hypothetical protein VNI83_02510 [Vicinamibacterales bacterium]|nr:hypothetical protein [Vicinamibacterales bacterium]